MKRIISSFIFLFLFILITGCVQNEAEKTYKVSFYTSTGTLIEVVEVKEGEEAICSNIPTHNRLVFVGWDEDVSNVTRDMSTKAIMELKSFSVKFLNEDGSIINEQTVFYGYNAVAPLDPTKVGYVFLRWDRSFIGVTEDLEIRPVFEPLPTSGSITYYDEEVELDLYPKEYNFGEVIDLPTPEKENCIFLGWFLADRSLTNIDETSSSWSSDVKLYAKFLETTRTIELPTADYHFTGIKQVLHSNNKDYLYQPIFPSGVSSSVTEYFWSTSDSKIATVSDYSSISIASNGYCILTATSKTGGTTINCIIKASSEGVSYATVDEANTVELCKVTFLGKDKEVIKETYCEVGGSVLYPKAPEYAGYKFDQWDKSNFNIKSDLTIQAQYVLGNSSYDGLTYGIIGDSISTFKPLIPEGFSTFYPYPVGDVSDYNKTWWMQVINGMGGTLLSNNSYSGSCVASTTPNCTSSLSRLQHTLINGVAPDVILIYMGSNDCASVNVNVNTFDSSYKTMIELLKEICPNSKLVVFTLPHSPSFFEETEWVKYNDVIKKYAVEFELPLVDLSTVEMSGHLIDAAHPQTSGMTLIANKVMETLKEE